MLTNCAECQKEFYGIVSNSIIVGPVLTSPRIYFCSDKCRKDYVLALPALPISSSSQVGDIVICAQTRTGEITQVAQVSRVREGFTNWGKPATFVSVDSLWDRNPNYRNGGGTFTFDREELTMDEAISLAHEEGWV